MQGNCLVAQSGGPTAVINASVAGVVEKAIEADEIKSVYGSKHGIKGIINGELFDFGREDRKEIELIKFTPSSILGTCRYQLADYEEDDEDYKKIFATFERFNIRYFFYIGGNDSMDTVDKLNTYAREHDYDLKVIGIAKTVDNDLMGTDHCPGYGSAAKYIASSVMEAGRDCISYDLKNVYIVEVMGRHAGWMAGAAALAKQDIGVPNLIYFPEVPFEVDNFLEDVEKVTRNKKKAVVVVSEGIRYPNGEFVMDGGVASHDSFGHKQMGGVCSLMASLVKEHIADKVRAIELSVLQRAAMHFVSGTDLDEAYRCGRDGVRYALAGETGKMIGLERTSENPYRCETTPIPVAKVANAEKKVPLEWINQEENTVTEEFLNYVRPLVQGTPDLPYENGLLRFAKLKKEL